jgi:hypothetical protein
MSAPGTNESSDTSPVLDGTDVSVDPADLDTASEASDVPATSDPEQLTDDDLGGVAGQGGAG